MKETGHNSFRTSIQWSRLIPDPTTGKVNQTAVDFYNQVIDDLLEHGIEPFMNLYHFDMPMVLQEKAVGKAVKWLICMLTLPKPVLNCLAIA